MPNLVLSRKRGESIIIDEGLVKITVEDIGYKQVRLAIHAPADIRVDREEVHEARKRDKRT